MRALAVYTSGRCADRHSAGPLRLQKTPACVDGDVVGGGFAAANHISVYITRGLVQTEGPGRVPVYTTAACVDGNGKGPQEGPL